MEHECFEDPEIAAILNRGFVSIKVDREERPDVDDCYMSFVQLSTGRGGWPMSVFLDLEKAPFFGGTYWPPKDRGPHLGFRSILLKMEELWKHERPQIDEAAAYYAGFLASAVEGRPSDKSERVPTATDLVQLLDSSFDHKYGGFGQAPKFPPHGSFNLLLSARDDALEMGLKTLERMALGGLHDHVGGGFHRYSTDAQWHLPHFEKTLYDNALLLKHYSTAAMLQGSSSERSRLFKRTADRIVEWLCREMRSPEGLFFSALDADSEGEEGKFYVWNFEELTSLPQCMAFATAYGCKPEGNFLDEATGLPSGLNLLHRAGFSGEEEDFDGQLGALLCRREARKRPMCDAKVLVGWNGLAISGLIAANRLDLATTCADALLRATEGFEELPRYLWDGTPQGLGFLEDYAYLARSLLELGKVQPGYRVPGYRLGKEMVAKFLDQSQGGFFASGSRHERLLVRSKPVFDQPIPSANSAAIEVLLEMGEVSLARKSVRALSGWMAQAPMACESLVWVSGKLPEEPNPMTFKLVSQSYSGPEFQATVGIILEPGWKLREGQSSLQVYANGQKLDASAWVEADGVVLLTISGSVESEPTELSFRFEVCDDQACLSPRTSILPL
jgi:uncharacterized protein YyaL (SSP411 family)